jgi:hypothetical protein
MRGIANRDAIAKHVLPPCPTVPLYEQSQFAVESTAAKFAEAYSRLAHTDMRKAALQQWQGFLSMAKHCATCTEQDPSAQPVAMEPGCTQSIGALDQPRHA